MEKLLFKNVKLYIDKHRISAIFEHNIHSRQRTLNANNVCLYLFYSKEFS